MKEEPCHYCGVHTFHPNNRSGRPYYYRRTKDHVLAKRWGGTTTVVCCLRCNTAKSAEDYEEFKMFADLFLRKKNVDVSTAALMFKAWLWGRVL